MIAQTNERSLGNGVRGAIAILLLIHVVLAVMYASRTPYRAQGRLAFQGGATALDIGAPDERQHANFVQRLLDGKGLPVLDPNDPNLYENYQAHQPPLYYFLAAGFSKVAGVSNVANPEGVRLRYLNAFVGAITIAGVFFLLWWGFGRRDLALLGSAFASLLPMHLALNGAISNDPLLICLCTWALAVTARNLVLGWTPVRIVGLAVLVAAAVFTKTTAIALFPAVFLSSLAKGNFPAVPNWRCAVMALVGACVLLAPWWFRNQQVYGDPLAMSAFTKSFTNSAVPADVALADIVLADEDLATKVGAYQQSHPDLQGRDLIRAADRDLGINSAASSVYWTKWVGWWTLRSFVGVFGYMDIFLPSQLYTVVLLVLLICAVGGVLNALKPDWRRNGGVQTLNWMFLAVIALLFIRFNLQYFQGQARYLLPAIGPWSLLIGLGLLYFSRDKWKFTLAALIALMLGLNVYVLQILPEEFARRLT